MAEYEAVIGLEVHAQLKTETKIFCSCPNRFGSGPNENVCPVCAGMPGVLPVMNGRVVEYAAKMALAVDCTVNPSSVFARKNYFYPDLPKGYQISQYEEPLAEHGHIDITLGDGTQKRIGITRIHMEEDAGKSIHSPAENVSFVDLNRCGTPLIEIVSEPDMRSPEEATAYLKSLRAILVYLGICDGNMEEGSFRCDANVSIRPRGQEAFGTRAELKNMNSFRHVQKGLEYEISRQIDLVEDGEAVIQETRLYDADRNVTQSMRGKEEAHDYRYFPDPDLLPVAVTDPDLKKWASELPELPVARRSRFIEEYGLPEVDAEVLTAERDLADYFELAVKAYKEPKKIANWIMTDLMRELNVRKIAAGECPFRPEVMAKLVRMVDEGAISGKIGKKIFPDIFEIGTDPEEYCKEKGLVQISDTSAIETAVDEVIAEFPDEVIRFRDGDRKLQGFFMGQIMKKTRGQANPKMAVDLLIKKVGA